MKEKDILATIRSLAHSQGFYGRLYNALMEAQDENPEGYAALMEDLEAQNFSDAIDLIFYIES